MIPPPIIIVKQVIARLNILLARLHFVSQVFSSVDFDFGSSCYLFTDCLAEIGDWSASNQDHFPIFVVIHHGGLQSATDILGTGAAYSTALTQLQVTSIMVVTSAGHISNGPIRSGSAVLQATNTLPTNFTTSQVADLADVEAEILQVLANNVCYACHLCH